MRGASSEGGVDRQGTPAEPYHLKNDRHAGEDWRPQQKKDLPLFAPALLTTRLTACTPVCHAISNFGGAWESACEHSGARWTPQRPQQRARRRRISPLGCSRGSRCVAARPHRERPAAQARSRRRATAGACETVGGSAPRRARRRRRQQLQAAARPGCSRSDPPRRPDRRAKATPGAAPRGGAPPTELCGHRVAGP